MSRRKITLPERLLNERIQQLSWNIANCERLAGRTTSNFHDRVIVFDNINVSKSNCPSSSSTSTEIQNVCLSSDDGASVDDIFYKFQICNDLCVNNLTSLLGCLNAVYEQVDCLYTVSINSDKKEGILDSSIVVKLCKDIKAKSVDVVTSETKDGNMNLGEGFVKVIATYEQIDGLAYLQKKGIIEIVADLNEIVNQHQCKLRVYLNESGFTTVTVPSEDPSMGKNFKSMKILMQWLHGPLLPDVNSQPTKHYDHQIESVFNILKSKKSCLSTAKASASIDEINVLSEAILYKDIDLDKLQHPSMVPLLRTYQKRAVHWMIEQENVDTKAFAAENKVPHPLWKPISLGDKQAYYNPYTGRICRDPIYQQGYPSGGILADEMGLGKTVEVLACILNNPREMEMEIKMEPGSGEELSQNEPNYCSSGSTHSTVAPSDEKDSMVKYPSEVDVTDQQQSSSKQPESIQEHKQSSQLPKKVENHLCEESNENGLNSTLLPSNHQFFEENVEKIGSINSTPQSVTEATASDSLLGSSKKTGEHPVGELNKRPLPLDSDVHIDNDRKKARLESCKDLPDVIQSILPNKSSLPFDNVVLNTTTGDGKMECNNTLTHLADNMNDNINHESMIVNVTKGVNVAAHNNGVANKNNVTPGIIQEAMEGLPDSRSSVVTIEKEKPVRCICGKNKAGVQEEVLTCGNCGFSQHPQCIGLRKTGETYVCPDCSVNMPLLESSATLIVSPVTIAHQWLDEIHRHILPGSLNVMIYKGVAKQGFVYPSVLAANDIILTTYEVLKRDFHHLASQKDNHSHRRPKRYGTWPCPLTCIKFWRICLDEAQMVENTTAKTTETALNLSAVHRWCITGTPIQKTIDDLRGLFLFLGVEPFYRKAWWKQLLYEPFIGGNSKPLGDVLYNVMWRTAKKDVIDEINLPEQKESMNWLNFSPVEYHFYRRQYEECSRSALKYTQELNNFHETETELNSLDRYSVHRVLYPLLKLRQACCHPQAVRGGYLTVQKNLITMEQLLESLIGKAKNESQDAHRQLLCALNGLAGTYILQENWQNAVDVYREAMSSWKEHEELFKTDSLQKLHTLHNLHEVLGKFNSASRTLRDDYLQEEASEIRDKYLQRWKDQLNAAENEAFNAQKAHDELKLKVDFKCPWWITYLQRIMDSENENPIDRILSERLVDKVKSDLAAVRNLQEHGSLSMADSFSDLHGLQLLLVRKFEAIEDCQGSLINELKSLMVEPAKEMVVSVAECCLRPAINSTAESCCFCQTNDTMSVYESLIFGQQGISNNDAESIGGLRAENEAVRTLKSIYSFLKSQTKRHDKLNLELQHQAQCHLEYLDLLKKNFKVYRQLWHALRQRVSALDELAMCTMRLRLRYRGEVVQSNQFYIVEPLEVESTQMGFRSDKVIANSSLRKCLGQLLYLKNLAKTQATDDGENSEPCPVCTKVLGYQWSVFSCGHCLCCQCMWVLLERPGIPGRAGSNVRCPMCRANTLVQDISYVSTIRQLTDEDKDLVVKGSHSTKIEAVVRTLMKIQRTDPQAKTLVFSTWQDVLDVISRALVENDMKFRSIKKSKDYQSSLEEFKTADDIPVLLIPLQSGSNGLNIIEATHVILVEPSLNPSLERQAVGRIHRIGQTKPTFIHRILIANTVEEKIMRFLQDKAESGMRCGTRRTDGENIPLTLGELASFFQPTESQLM